MRARVEAAPAGVAHTEAPVMCAPWALHDTRQAVRWIDEALQLHRLHHHRHRREDHPDRAVGLVRGPSIPAAAVRVGRGHLGGEHEGVIDVAWGDGGAHHAQQ